MLEHSNDIVSIDAEVVGVRQALRNKIELTLKQRAGKYRNHPITPTHREEIIAFYPLLSNIDLIEEDYWVFRLIKEVSDGKPWAWRLWQEYNEGPPAQKLELSGGFKTQRIVSLPDDKKEGDPVDC